MKLWLLALFIVNFVAATPTPIVLWHGMGDTCCMSYSLGYFKTFLEEQIPGVYVKSLMIGNSTVEDFENGYFMNPNKQVELVCKELANDPELQTRGGFNVIGFSQGSQFLRAVVQRCSQKLPPIKNLISIGGQHQGVYGLPRCNGLEHKMCDYIRKLLNYAAYYTWVQNSLVQATYWHDPLDEKTYNLKSEFLADINNERTVNEQYKTNLMRLEHFVMVKFEDETIVQPKETEWFGYYAPGQAKKMLKLQDMEIYKQDRLGLKEMDEAGKLVFLSSPGDHLRFSEEFMIDNIIKPYLNLETPAKI